MPEETPEELEKISYDNDIFCAKVTAEFEGVELASDYLGGCIYTHAAEFYTDYKDHCFADMVENVMKEAKIEIFNLKKRLEKLELLIESK